LSGTRGVVEMLKVWHDKVRSTTTRHRLLDETDPTSCQCGSDVMFEGASGARLSLLACTEKYGIDLRVVAEHRRCDVVYTRQNRQQFCSASSQLVAPVKTVFQLP